MLLVVAAVVVVGLAAAGGGREYRVVFDSAGQLVKGDLVRIGGARAGTVDAVRLTRDDRAEVVIALDAGRPPLHEGTTAVIRAQGLTGVASRYVDITPAPDFEPAIADGGTIGADRTTAIVEVDELFNTLDPPTREGLRRLIRGSGDWYDGKEAEANASARYFGPAIGQLSALAREITRDSATFEDFVVEVGDTLSVLGDRRAELTSLVSGTRRTASALAADSGSLERALTDLPPALREGSHALARLRPAVGDLRTLVRASDTPSRELAPFLRDLRPVVEQAVPVFGRLRTMFAQPGDGNDLLDALTDLPPLQRLSTAAFPSARRALADATPIFAFGRPYVPDLVGWARSFGGAMATYDANGHYARTLPVFDAFTFTDDAEGGTLSPKPYADRGRSPYLRGGNLRRCPGTAGVLPDDGSAPFVDDGPDANADCDPSQVVR